MPPDVHAALRSATDAAAHLRSQLSDLAATVERGNEDAIVLVARALVTGEPAITNPNSPDTPEPRTDPGHPEESPHE